MAARALLPQPDKGVEVKLKKANVEWKSKNIPTEGRNRRALGDIGNIVALTAADLKPQPHHPLRPATRSLTVQNDGDHGAKNKKQAIVAAINGNQKKKPIDSDRTEAAIAESPKKDESEINDAEFTTARRSIQKSSNKKPGRSLTAILSARSKAVCGGDHEKNIDEGDENNERAVVEYVDDIYKFYKETEGEIKIRDYMKEQKEINSRMRSILVDWLIEVHHKFELMAETLYLTINIVDRYLSTEVVKRSELQLVGIGAMLIACKYEEIWAPHVEDFVCISDRAYKKEQVLAMERCMLGKLEWHLTVPTCYVFLVRFLKASSCSSSESKGKGKAVENTAWYLAELGQMNYEAAVRWKPSLMAAGAVYAAGCGAEREPRWSTGMKKHTGYSEEEVVECGRILVGLQLKASSADCKLRALHRKFSKGERGRIPVLTPSPSLLLPPPTTTTIIDSKQHR